MVWYSGRDMPSLWVRVQAALCKDQVNICKDEPCKITRIINPLVFATKALTDVVKQQRDKDPLHYFAYRRNYPHRKRKKALNGEDGDIFIP
jgi:hypothetical protein